MNATRTRPALLSFTALALAVTLSACGALGDDPVVHGTLPALTSAPTTAPTTPAAAVGTGATAVTVAAPVAGPNDQVVGGVLYAGTAKAPVKIGSDTPGQPPAAEATFPVHGASQAIKAAAIALPTKYVVIISKVTAADDTMATGPVLGYTWSVFGINEYGNWRSLEKSETLPTKAAAADASPTLGGRVLDRAEFVIAYYA